MEKNELKAMWQEMNTRKATSIKVDIEKIIKKEHSVIISKVLSAQKLKIQAYAIILAIFISLILSAFVYFGLRLSVYSIVSLSLAGLFLFFKTVFEINRLRILKTTINDVSIKESALLFRKKLNYIKTIDFISALVYCYGWAIGMLLVLFNDFDGVKNLLPLLIVLILLLFLAPWFVKYLYNQQYKRVYANLNKSIDFFDEAS